MNSLEYYEEGKSLYSKQKFPEALEMFLKALDADSENLDILFSIGSTYYELNKFVDALKYFEAVLAKDNMNIKANIGKINVTENDDLDDTLEKIEFLISNNPSDGVLWARKAIKLLEMNQNREKVCESLFEAIKSSSYRAYVNYVIAITYSEYLDWENSKKYFNKALKLIDRNKTKLDPNHYISYYDILLDKFFLHYKLNEFDEALDICDELLKINNKNIDVLYAKAHIYWNMGKLERAKNVIEFGLIFYPKNIDLLNLKGIILELENSPKYAIRIFKKIIGINEEYEYAWANISKIYYQEKEYHKSLKYAKKTLEINPNSAFGLYWGSRALYKIGEKKLAREWKKKLSKPEVEKILLEKNLQDRLIQEPWRFEAINYNIKLISHEYSIPNNNGRIDLLYEDNNGDLVVVELKVVMATKDTYGQIKNYMDSIKHTIGKNKKIKGIVISFGQDENFKSLIKNNDIIQVDYNKLGL